MRRGRVVVTPRRREQIDTRQLAEAVMAALRPEAPQPLDQPPVDEGPTSRNEAK